MRGAKWFAPYNEKWRMAMADLGHAPPLEGEEDEQCGMQESSRS